MTQKSGCVNFLKNFKSAFKSIFLVALASLDFKLSLSDLSFFQIFSKSSNVSDTIDHQIIKIIKKIKIKK